MTDQIARDAAAMRKAHADRLAELAREERDRQARTNPDRGQPTGVPQTSRSGETGS